MHQYQQLDVWKRSLALATSLQTAGRTSRSFVDRAAWSQIVRAALSVPANIAEGAIRNTPKEFVQFLAIAIGSSAELHTLLLVARECGLIDATQADHTSGESVEIRKMLVALRARIQGLQPRRRRTPQERQNPQGQ